MGDWGIGGLGDWGTMKGIFSTMTGLGDWGIEGLGDKGTRILGGKGIED